MNEHFRKLVYRALLRAKRNLILECRPASPNGQQEALKAFRDMVGGESREDSPVVQEWVTHAVREVYRNNKEKIDGMICEAAEGFVIQRCYQYYLSELKSRVSIVLLDNEEAELASTRLESKLSNNPESESELGDRLDDSATLYTPSFDFYAKCRLIFSKLTDLSGEEIGHILDAVQKEDEDLSDKETSVEDEIFSDGFDRNTGRLIIRNRNLRLFENILVKRGCPVGISSIHAALSIE